MKKGRKRNYGICYTVRSDCDSCTDSLVGFIMDIILKVNKNDT